MTGRVTRVAVLGLGRIGRNLFRLLHDRDDLRLEAVSDPSDRAALAYLLRFDTLLGRFPAPVTLEGDTLHAGGRQVRLLAGTPQDASWGDLGVDTVIETSGRSRSRADLERHLAAGAKRVILCAPAAPAMTGQPSGAVGNQADFIADLAPDVMVVAGVNDAQLRAEHRIISHASPAAHAAAPVVKILHQAFGIERAFLNTVHAYVDQQHLADVPAADPRWGRAAAQNIIPLPAAAADVVMALLPALRGKLSGSSMNVPVANGSAVDLVCWHPQPVSVEDVNRAVRQAVAGLAGILAYEEEPIVSADVQHATHSGIFDSQATMVLGGRVSKTLTWFDNSWAYAQRALDLVVRCRQLDDDADAPADATAPANSATGRGDVSPDAQHSATPANRHQGEATEPAP
jgi:glyceraldehyde 3-phosphate dehydrogenase